jgi:hypothetical protein
MAIPLEIPCPEIAQIKFSEEERASGVPNPLTVERALAALHQDGSSTVTIILK